MDLFGRKRIRELEAELDLQDGTIQQAALQLKSLLSENRELKNQVEYLVRTIRQMDDQIFSMSQCTDWPSMRPHFATLSDGMTARKVAESNRIADVLRPQLIDTYKPTKTDPLHDSRNPNHNRIGGLRIDSSPKTPST